MFVLDSHCDTPSQIHRLRNIGVWNGHGQVDLPKMKKGGVDGAFFALYVPSSLGPEESTAYAMELMADVYDAVGANRDSAAMVTCRQEALEAQAKGLVSIFLGLHSDHNDICDSSGPSQPRWGGLSPFGREVVAEMNRLGMLVDVSHISDRSFYDVLECSAKPVVATHSCCRALAGHRRNLTDDMIKALASQGGVVQINFYPVFLDDGFAARLSASGIESVGEAVEAEFIKDPSDPQKREAWYRIEDELASLARPSYRRIADHVDHVVSLVGPDHAGLGSDFDGISVTPDGMEDVSHFSRILDELRHRGYSEGDIAKIAGGNFLRVLG